MAPNKHTYFTVLQIVESAFRMSSIYQKVYLHKEWRLCFQAISSFHAAFMEECENEAVGELLEKFCCVRELISI